MLTGEEFRTLALSMPRAAEKAHFERLAFYVDIPKGKIYATLPPDGQSANLNLESVEQEMLINAEPAMFSKVPGGWGERGWTTIGLAATDRDTALSALGLAWRHAAPGSMRGLADAVLLRK